MTREEIVNSLTYQANIKALLECVDDDVFSLGAEFGYKFAIDKICNWLEENINSASDMELNTWSIGKLTTVIRKYAERIK